MSKTGRLRLRHLYTRHRFHRPTQLPALINPTHSWSVETHHIFGIGLFAEVPDAYLETIADPFDLIKMVYWVASRVADGRSGRFGWQAEMARSLISLSLLG